MTPEQYVARVRELVAAKAYAEALKFAERHGPEVDERMTPEQFGAVSALLHHADMVHAAQVARQPVRVER